VPAIVARAVTTPEHESLKPTSRRVFDQVCAALVAGEPVPTVRELGAAVGLCSPCIVTHHLTQLIAVRLLWRDIYKSRGLRLHERFYGAARRVFHGCRSVKEGKRVCAGNLRCGTL